MIDKNLQFASDMRVILYNCQKTMLLRRETWEVLGEFSVPVKSIQGQLFKKPQYFNVVNNDGELQGQVLARFFLKEIDPNKKNDEHVEVIRELNSLT